MGNQSPLRSAEDEAALTKTSKGEADPGDDPGLVFRVGSCLAKTIFLRSKIF